MGDKPNMNGKWSFHSQENFQEYLAENGEGFVDIFTMFINRILPTGH